MNNPGPPRWIINLIEWYCDPILAEGILGDLFERYEVYQKLYGSTNARIIYCWQAIGFFRWNFRDKNKNFRPMYSIWLNYFRTARRSMMRNKLFFSINLIGLIFAITSTLFAFIYVQDDLAYDHMHQDKDQIFRLYKRHLNENENIDHLTAENSGLMGPTMKREYPEVEEIVRVCPWWGEVLMYHDDKMYSTNGWYFADSTFFDVFDFQLISGDPQQALIRPKSVVISASLAQRIYKDRNPIGQTFTGFGDLDYVVTGVMEDVPRQSTLQFEVLASWTTTVPGVGPLSFTWMNNWLAQGIFTFVKLGKQANPDILASKLPAMMQEYFPERADQYFLRLQPLSEVHLHSENIKNQRGMDLSSMRFIYLLLFSAALLIIIAIINYINISLSRSIERHMEVGVRKVMGSSNGQLLGRFIIETFISTVVASLLGLMILALLLPSVNQITGKNLPVELLYSFPTISALFLFCITFSLIMGLYPAIIMSRPKVTDILQNNNAIAGRTGIVRKALLGLQYAVATILIITTIAIIQQIHFLKNKPLGFDKENVVVVDIDNEVSEQAELFEAALKKHPNIKSVSIGRSALGGGSYSTTFIPEGKTDELSTRIFIVDPEFFETYGINTIMGRTFLSSSTADSNNVIVNKSMIDYLQWKDPLNKRLKSQPDSPGFPIVGVVEDFHYNSLATATIEPMAIFLGGPTENRNASIKLGSGNIENTLAHIENSWNEFATKSPFDYYFVDQWFDELYSKEAQLVKTSSAYSLICLLLCALGLYGLTALILGQRIKEISIRKVLGANVHSIIALMGRQFIPIIIAGLFIAVPISYWVLNKWLTNFAYKINLGAASFVIASGVILIISFLIIGILAARAASLNPSKSLS